MAGSEARQRRPFIVVWCPLGVRGGDMVYALSEWSASWKRGVKTEGGLRLRRIGERRCCAGEVSGKILMKGVDAILAILEAWEVLGTLRVGSP